jgi:DNA-binding protein HU-beta
MALKAAAKKKVAAKKAVKKAAPRKAPAKKAAAKKSVGKAAPAMKAVKVTTPAGKSVTQSALMQLFADQNELPKSQAKALVESYLDIVKAHVLKGVKVKLGDIGMLMIRHRKARIGRNPQTGEPVKIKASKKLAFRQSATMREAVR